MKRKLIILFSIFGLLLTSLVWLYPSQEISEDERRKLNQFPDLSMKTVSNGDFMNKFEDYAKDQFPFRYNARQTKALFRYYGLGIRENNNIYKDGKKAIKIEYPLKENEIKKGASKFNYINDTYLTEDNNIYLSLIPDKSYYSSQTAIPKIDFNSLEEIFLDEINFGDYISIKDTLTLDDFYNTDIHWKSENLENVAQALFLKMNIDSNINYTIEELNTKFKGVYSGHSALPLKSDTIKSIRNKSIDEATLKLINSDESLPIYSLKGLESQDQYDYYLYGPQAIVEIDSPNAHSDKELIVFRDSYASSLIPYFMDNYSKITLVDIRYISSNALNEYIEFNDQDVLFIYNTSILNSSTMLK